MFRFSLLTRRNDQRRKYQPCRYQPRLELLEGRALPSILMVTNNSDTGVMWRAAAERCPFSG
jgi:hypothetical protein